MNVLLSLLMLEQVAAKDAAMEQLQKQINDIVLELNVLKEQQALQAGKLQIQKSNTKGEKKHWGVFSFLFTTGWRLPETDTLISETE